MVKKHPVVSIKVTSIYLHGVPKMCVDLTLYFEAVTTIMSRILGFSVSPDLYNSFDTLFICFHDLMNKWQ